MIALVVFLLITGIVLFPLIKRSFLSKAHPETLDLDSVRDAMVEKHGWSLERADAARTEYVRFLTLLQMKPGFMLVPWLNADGKDDLDQFWHQHILDTVKYAADCHLLFGQIIHHNPHVVRGSEQETDAVLKTQRLYARTFGAGTYGSPVDAGFLTGCGTCATVETHAHGSGGHGSGGHDSSGHDSGGHDSGSHSCGGHGCGGHGCGGH